MSKAETLAAKPTKALQALVDEVRDAADRTQSYSYAYFDADDGRVLVECWPTPAFSGRKEPEAARDHNEALLWKRGSELLTSWAVPVALTARGDVADRDPRPADLGAYMVEADDDGRPPAHVRRWVTQAPGRSLRAFPLEDGTPRFMAVELEWRPADHLAGEFVDRLGDTQLTALPG